MYARSTCVRPSACRRDRRDTRRHGIPSAGARLAVDPPARASATPCVPARGLVVALTIRRALEAGSEVTEPLANGGYRITRCDTQGRTKIGMTVLPIADTGGKRHLLPAVIVRRESILAPDVRRSDPRHALPRTPFTAACASCSRPCSHGHRDARAATPTTRPPATSSPPRRRGRPATDDTHAASPGGWPENRYAWRWNAESFGSNSTTLTALERDHDQWDKTVTDCSGMKDTTNFTTTYDGTTTNTAGVHDGVNTVDKADLSDSACGSTAIACTWMWWVEDSYTESDTRVATDVKWSNSGARRHVRLPGHRGARVRACDRPQRPRRLRQTDDALPGHARLHRPTHTGPRRHLSGRAHSTGTDGAATQRAAAPPELHAYGVVVDSVNVSVLL